MAAIAFIQQNNRNIAISPTGERYIEATPEDYGEARTMVETLPLETGNDVLSEEAVKLFSVIKNQPEFCGATSFTRIEIRQKLQVWRIKRIRNSIDALIENDLLNCSVGKKNRKEYRLSAVGRTLNPGQVFFNPLLSLSTREKIIDCLARPSFPE